MAQISFNDVIVNDGNNNNSNQVGFFNLKSDGEEAIVRFMIDSVEDMEILTVHDIHVDGKFRQISCVRDPREPIEKCPLCARNEKIKQVVFIKMIQYVNTPDGKIEAQPVVWQRSASTYAHKIKGYLDNYGPLSNILCKVIRHGARGDMKTTYDIIPNLNPTQFPPESFPIVEGAFNDYKACGRVVLDKNIDEINTFINTGSFPETTSNTASVTPQPAYSNVTPQPVNNTTTVPGVNMQYQTPQLDPNTVTSTTTTPGEVPGMPRPTRYY